MRYRYAAVADVRVDAESDQIIRPDFAAGRYCSPQLRASVKWCKKACV